MVIRYYLLFNIIFLMNNVMAAGYSVSLAPIEIESFQSKFSNNFFGKNERRDEPRVIDSKEFKALPTSTKEPVWGDKTKIKECFNAEYKLAVVGLNGSEPSKPEDSDVELAFANACLIHLNQQNEDLSKHINLQNTFINPVGRLISDFNKILCTATLLSPQYAITARHCFFTEQIYKSNLYLTPNFKVIGSRLVEFGPINSGQKSTIKAVWLNIDNNDKNWSRFTQADLQSKKVVLKNLTDFQRDYIVLELNIEINNESKVELAQEEISTGEKMFLPAFYSSYFYNNISNDTGIRVQIAGRCQVIVNGPGKCLKHACATSEGASGAPIFKSEIANGVTYLKLVGLHTSGSSNKTHCASQQDEFKNAINYAVKFDKNELQHFVTKE